MAITIDDTHHTNNQGDISPHQEIDLTGAAHITTSVGPNNIMLNIPFTPQQKAFIMSLFGIEVPSASNSTPPVPIPLTPTSMQTKVQAMMNDIKATVPS